VNVPALVLVTLYAVVLVIASVTRGGGGTGLDYLLDGRRLTLPAFVATLVTTWYGGILGIGEYAWRFGISTWVVFGLPYYFAAILFALVLAPRLRRSAAVSIPELMRRSYGPGAGRVGAAMIWAVTVPVAYVLMSATLLESVTGWSPLAATVIVAAFSAGYVGLSGFRAVVRTDAIQLVLMYGGFLILLPAALAHTGGFVALWHALPATHRSVDGGLGWQAVLVWYLIALQTMVEPAFYQRVFAARTERTARLGVLASVVMWAAFDFLSVTTGLAARVLLPDLADPLAAYPALAQAVLPTWLAAMFVVGLFATVMSTLDSYLFLAAATVGHDFTDSSAAPEVVRRRTRLGLAISAAAAGAVALAFDSAVAVWHHLGTIGTSALLLPVVAIHAPARWRFRPGSAVLAVVGAAATAAGWIAAASQGRYPAGIEPMFPALAVSVAVWLADRALDRNAHGSPR